MNLANVQSWLSIIGSAIALIGVPILIYKSLNDPDEKAKKRLDIFDTRCVLKHNRIDEIFEELKENMKSINYTFQHFRENEFKHIEQDVRKISDMQTEIMTIFKEREKNK